MTEQPLIAWIDVETTGLDPSKDVLLEVALVLTDHNFVHLEEASYRIDYPQQVLKLLYRNSDPVVQKMHRETGLWERDENAKYLGFVDSLLSDIPRRYAKFGKPLMGGNSITLDRNFLEAYLPRTFESLSYQSIDMTSVSQVLALTTEYFWPEKEKRHRALEDVYETIGEAKYAKDFLDKLADGLE